MHPDRNYGNTQFTTQLFAEIQSAYEVLSDPQERAWYDSHRHAFVGADGSQSSGEYSYNTRMTSTDNIYKLFSRFNPQMEFSDSQTGFYGGLRETFERLAVEEKVACQWENLEMIDYPTFGFSYDIFEDVRRFYLVWNSFSTRKSFAWKDIYRYSEAPDRRVRRLMEKENRRLREESIREFNDAVRSLVAFAKKRDPRCKANAQNEAQRQETLRQASAAQAARSRAANKAKLREVVTPEWAKGEDLEEDHTSVSEDELERFECVVCHKNFKNSKQLEAHERSKKHKKALKQLCWEMKSQNRHFGLDVVDDHDADVDPVTNSQHLGQCDSGLLRDMSCSSFRSDASNSGLENFGDFSAALPTCQTPMITRNTQDPSLAPGNDPSGTNCTRWPVLASGDNDSDYATMEYGEHQFHPGVSSHRCEMNTLADTSEHLSDSGSFELSSTAPYKLGKAKQKRNKKAAKVMAQQSMELVCAICNASFPSRTQLFRHIRELDHVQTLDRVKGKQNKP